MFGRNAVLPIGIDFKERDADELLSSIHNREYTATKHMQVHTDHTDAKEYICSTPVLLKADNNRYISTENVPVYCTCRMHKLPGFIAPNVVAGIMSRPDMQYILQDSLVYIRQNTFEVCP